MSRCRQGTLAFSWDGRDDRGAWVADGTYRSVVSAQTGLGTYSQERQSLSARSRLNVSNAAPARGETVTLNLVSTESLERNPTVRVTQDGFDAVERHRQARQRPQVPGFGHPAAGGPAGSVEFEVMRHR